MRVFVFVTVRMQISYVLVVMYVLSTVYCQSCQKTCHIGRLQGRRTADCYKRDMTVVPQCLPRNTEILDLSFNRIRKVLDNDLKEYPYLEILYLSDNILIDFEEKALDYQTSLQILDVSTNALYKIPKAFFSLPVLRKLYLGGMENRDMIKHIESAVPITSPIQYLDLSNNRLERLPMLGEVPSLLIYNVSSNPNIKLNTSMFAGLCSLEEFVTIKSQPAFKDACDCHVLEDWLSSRKVKFTPFNCPQKECSKQVPQEDLDVFNSCRKLHEAQQQQLYQQRLLRDVGISVGTIVIFLLIVLFFIFRRRKVIKQKKEGEAQKKQMKEVIDNQVLL